MPKHPESPEFKRNQERERTAEALIEEILESSQFRDVGTEGIIYRLEKDNIPEGLIDFLESQEISLEGDLASKVFKIYTKGQGENEFKALKRAYKYLEELPDTSNYALVPNPIFFKEIEISDSTKKSLGERGKEIVGNKVEVILMDYVKGDDLMTLLYGKSLQYIQEEDYDEKRAEEMDYLSLTRFVEDELI